MNFSVQITQRKSKYCSDILTIQIGLKIVSINTINSKHGGSVNVVYLNVPLTYNTKQVEKSENIHLKLLRTASTFRTYVSVYWHVLFHSASRILSFDKEEDSLYCKAQFLFFMLCSQQ